MGEIDAVSAVLAAARWFASLASVLVIGHVGARFVCRWAFENHAPAEVVAAIARRQARSAAFASILLLISAAVLLLAQSYSWYGTEGMYDHDKIVVMVHETRWGEGWFAAAATAIAGVLASLIAWRWSPARTLTSLALALGVALVVPLVGHGGGHSNLNWMVHAGHLLGAGLWVGTLTVLLITTWPIWTGGESTRALLPRVLARFSPLALIGAGLMVVTGVLLANGYLLVVSDLWETEFGRTLFVKTTVVAATATLGFVNWRRLTPRVADDRARAGIRRVAVAEAVLAMVVILGLTAWLSGLAIPSILE